MDEDRDLVMDGPSHASPCRRTGSFVSKGGCFALRTADGREVWLDIDPVPLHMLDEEVEITGRAVGDGLVWVQTIGPARRFS
jgi:hypothetical protein